MLETWTKNTYVCDPDECDTLIEVTSNDRFGFPSGSVRNVTCPCGRTPVLVSVADATIPPMNERNEMETTEKDAMVAMWRQELDLTYGNQITELQNKNSALQQRITNLEDFLSRSQGTISKIIDNLDAQGWYNPNYEKADVLSDLCEILDHEPKQEITIKGTLTFELRYDCPLDEVEDFDARYFAQDTLSLDAYNGDVIVDSFDVEDADVDWN